MRNMLLLCAACAIAISAAVAQPKIVHFKKLQELLPTIEIKEFQRGKPTGRTQTAMGMTQSEAAVSYTKPGNDTIPNQTIEIKIADMVLMPYGLYSLAFQQDMENETENGFEKTLWVKKLYRGMEKASTGESKSCALMFGVGNRFNVTIEANGFSDVKILEGIVDGMDLDKLSKTDGGQ